MSEEGATLKRSLSHSASGSSGRGQDIDERIERMLQDLDHPELRFSWRMSASCVMRRYISFGHAPGRFAVLDSPKSTADL